MCVIGYYYLHVNGDLIFKRELDGTYADLRESDFAKAIWPVDPTDRATAWDLLVEALASGADRSRVAELAAKWECDDEDACHYAAHRHFIIKRDGDSWCATREDFVNLQESPCGFGDRALEAMGELCKDLGYKPSKIWGDSFKDLLRAAKEER